MSDLSRYEFLDLLGEGAMASVYRARDRELQRLVAIKVLKDEVAARAIGRKRFVREARSAARLRHPSIVRVHDAGEDDGRFFIVLELVEGQPLHRVLASGRKTRRDLVAIVEAVARAAHHAHERGIVHRDVKPANILVGTDGRTRLSDFGLAHVRDETALTREDAALGTPNYMAPEQVSGGSDRVSPRTDVYALGVVLYEILTSRRPHDGASTMEVFERIATEDPVPPREIAPDVDPGLEAIVLACLEKDPDRRYRSAEALADDLERWLAGEPVLARPRSRAVTLWRRHRRHPGAWAAIGFLTASAGALGGWALSVALAGGGPIDPPPAATPVRPDSAAPDLARRARALELLGTVGPALDRAEASLYAADLDPTAPVRQAGEARGRILEALALAPDLAIAHYQLARARGLEGEDAHAETALRRAVELDPTFAPAHYRLGRLLLFRAFVSALGTSEDDRAAGRPLAREAAAGAVAAFSAARDVDDALQRDVARALLAWASGDHDVARRIAASGIERFAGQTGVEDFHWIAGVTSGGDEARASFDRAIELRPHDAVALFCRGMWRLNRGDPAGARADLDRAIAVRPRFAYAWVDRSLARRRLGDLDGAVTDAARAIDIDPGLAAGWANRAAALADRGDLEAARADADRAVELAPGEAWVLADRGTIRRATGDVAGALADYDRALELAPGHVHARVQRGTLRLEAGDVPGALEDLDAAVRSDPRSARARAARGRARARAGDPRAALTDYDVAVRLAPANASNRNERGLLRRETGDLDGAAADYDAAIRLDPAGASAHSNRGSLRRHRGDLDGAIDDYSRAIEIDPGHVEAHANRGLALAIRGDLAGAIRDFERALEVAPPGWPGRASVETMLERARRER